MKRLRWKRLCWKRLCLKSCVGKGCVGKGCVWKGCVEKAVLKGCVGKGFVWKGCVGTGCPVVGKVLLTVWHWPSSAENAWNWRYNRALERRCIIEQRRIMFFRGFVGFWRGNWGDCVDCYDYRWMCSVAMWRLTFAKEKPWQEIIISLEIYRRNQIRRRNC